MTIRSYVLLLVVTAVTGVSHAATKIEKIRELIATQFSEEMIEELRIENVEETKALILKQVGEKAKDPLMERLLDRAMEKYDSYSKELFDWRARERESIAFYEEHFTSEQIDAIWAFYKSEAGQALLEAQPLLMSRLQKTLFHTETERRARIDRILKETIAEIEKELRAEKSSPAKPKLPPVKIQPPPIPPPNLKSG